VDNKRAKQVGTLLRKRREAMGVSTYALSERTGLPTSTIVRIEAGSFASPNPEKLARIAKVLRISIADIYATAGYGVAEQLPAPRAYFRMKLSDMPTRKAETVGREVEALLKRHGVDLSDGPTPGEDEDDEYPITKAKKKGGKR